MIKTIEINEPLNDPLDEKNFHLVKASLYNSKGVNYIDFKKSIKPHYLQIWVQILLGWLFLSLSIFGGIQVLNLIENTGLRFVFTIADAILVGFTISYLVNFFHEAAHYNIARVKNINDTLANVFLGILQAQSIKHYRFIHWKHHVHHGSTEDTERSYFDALTLRFFIESLSGIRALRIFLFRNNKVMHNTDIKLIDIKKEGRLMLIAGICFHLIVIICLAIIQQYWVIATWVIGFGTFFPFFSSLRQLLEHRSDAADKQINYSTINHGKITRVFSGDFFSAIYGSAGFNRHLIHHLEPQISYTNLKEVEAFLLETKIAHYIQNQKTSYLKAFITLFGK